MRVGQEALSIHPEKHSVTIRRVADGTEYVESYDKLILSPGARALRPDLPGIDNPRIFTLRTVEDTLRIRAYLDRRHPQSAVVVGGGFIGLEMAENLLRAGVETTMLQRSNQVLPPLDYDMAQEVHSYLRGQGLDLRLNTTITGFDEKNDKIFVNLSEGDPVAADLVLLAVGVTPESDLARRAGLALGLKGAIAVDEHMRTSHPDVYAVGDAVELTHSVTGQKAVISLAGPANKQGRIVADHIANLGGSYAGAQGSSIIKLFDMTAASTGLNEITAKAAGFSYDKAITYSASHASYYPGAKNMTVKTLFDPDTGRILGAQIVGFDGVDKRIDVLATAIRSGLTAAGLTELDLAYAPPYASAKDPVNMAGYVIENIRSGLVRQHHWHDLASLPKDGSVALLDVRTADEVAQQGLLEGAIHIPLDDLRDRLHELDPDKKIYVNCYSGLRSYLACRLLTQRGFQCSNLSGGWRFYSYAAGDRVHDAAPTHPCGVAIAPKEAAHGA